MLYKWFWFLQLIQQPVATSHCIQLVNYVFFPRKRDQRESTSITDTPSFSLSLQSPSLSIHSGLLCCPARSHGGSDGGSVPPCGCGGSSSCSGGGGLPSAAPARRSGPDAGSPLQHRGQGHPELLPGIPGQSCWRTIQSPCCCSAASFPSWWVETRKKVMGIYFSRRDSKIICKTW